MRFFAALLLAVCSTVSAQQWPTKTVRIIATLAPGSAVDIVGRTLAERLAPVLGHPVIVENRPGASTMLAAAAVAKADPDGHTLLVNTSSHTVSPVGPALQLIRDGKLRALAIGGPKRSGVLPDLPTTIEAGYPNSDYNFWVGLFAPAKTPRAIVERLYKETVAAVQVPEVKERLQRLGAEPRAMPPGQVDP